MQTLEKVRLQKGQQAALEDGRMIAIQASWEEFEEFIAETDYRTEYYNGQIIIMGLASFIHELLVIRIGHLLTNFYVSKPYYVLGSNTGIRKEGERGHYNGDIVVLKGEPVFVGKSRSIISNPHLIVEVLSESTFSHDLGAKRRVYEQMDSVQEIVFVNPFDREVVVCRRTAQDNVWTETTYKKLEETVSIDNYQVQLSEIFANLPDEAH